VLGRGPKNTPLLCDETALLIFSVTSGFILIVSFVFLCCRLYEDVWGWSSVKTKWSILHETYIRFRPTLLDGVLRVHADPAK